MRLLLVLNGESYRSGGQMSRERGTKNYTERQHLASNSHIKLMDELKRKYNVDTDIIIYTYKFNEKDDNGLLDMYSDKNIIYSNFITSICKSEMDFLKTLHEQTKKYLPYYDYCIFIRIDLFIKDYFIRNLTLDDRIMFPHIDSNFDIKEYNIKKERLPVSHVIIYYPKRYFHLIGEGIEKNLHMIRNNLVEMGAEIYYMINTLHICSTNIASNPIYCQVGRKYLPTCEYGMPFRPNYYHIYDPESKEIVENIDLVKNKWMEYEDTEEKELLSRICY